MGRYLPVLLGVVLIVGLTIPQIQMTDRLSGTNVSAEQRAELVAKVPSKIGDWVGQDKPVDENVRKTAGAIGAVSRTYRNSRTGELVDLWLIVGHARDVSFHTPDVCYPAQGFVARATENSVYPMVFPDQPETPFLTNTFLRESAAGQQLQRVFWNWYNPENKENDGKVLWEAPKNARWHFGNTRALYKMYLTSAMRDPKETAEQSPCVRFAREFLPEVKKALAEVQLGAPSVEAGGKPATETVSGAVSKSDAEQAAAKEAREAAPAEKGTPKVEATLSEPAEKAKTESK